MTTVATEEQLFRKGAIVMAVYRPNHQLLERQILSLRRQSRSDWNCYVGFDGPDPETMAKLELWIDGDDRFVVVENTDNVGFYRNFERTMALVPEGRQWLALCDQDDMWGSTKLERLVAELKKSEAWAVSGQARLVAGDGHVLGVTARRNVPPSWLIFNNQFTGSLTVFDARILEACFPFPPPRDASYHDHWLAVLGSVCGSVQVVNDIVQDYVQHGSNVIGDEASGRRFGTRVRSLWEETGGLFALVQHLAAQRWSWRVDIARRALSAADLAGSNAPEMRSVSVIAHGRVSLPLLWDLALACRHGALPWSRGCALALGAVLWKQSLVSAPDRGHSGPNSPGAHV